jgi:hypothetical protein
MEDSMIGEEKIIWCAGCGIEISWAATIKKGSPYCCEDCFEGKSCLCADSQELDLDIRVKQGFSREVIND